MVLFKAAVASCPGKNNTHNGDNFYFNSKIITDELSSSQVLLSHKKEQKGLQIYAVSDGSGAEQYRDEASLIAVRKLLAYHKHLVENPRLDIKRSISEYIDTTNEAVIEKIAQLNDRKIYSTIALLCIKNDEVLLCNAGDTKIFLYRNKNLSQLSEDHTQAQRMVKLGLLTPEKAKTHIKRHKLIQYFGESSIGMPIEPYFTSFNARDNDIYLICSNGFCEIVPEERIAQLMMNCKTPADTVEILMSEAVSEGLSDDATVMAVQAFGDGLYEEEDEDIILTATTSKMGSVTNNKPYESISKVSSQNLGSVNYGSARESRKLYEVDEDSDVTVAPEYRQSQAASGGIISRLIQMIKTGDNGNKVFTPTVIMFLLCAVIVFLMAIFGYNIYKKTIPYLNSPTPTPTTNNTDATPTPSGNPLVTEGPDIITSSPGTNPTPTPTQGNNATPTPKPSATPKVTPRPTPTPGPTPTPDVSTSPTPTPEVTPEPTPTPDVTPEPTPTATTGT